MPPVLVERGLERCRFDRHHLLRGSLSGDRRQVNESCHAAPCGARSPFERFLVEIDAILSGWLRLIEARQHKRRIEANDGRRGASGHLRLSAEMRACAFRFSSSRTGKTMSDIASTSVARAGIIPRVRTKRDAAPGAAQCIHYRKFGGGWRGFMITKATSTKSTNFTYAPQLRCEQDGDGVLFLSVE